MFPNEIDFKTIRQVQATSVPVRMSFERAIHYSSAIYSILSFPLQSMFSFRRTHCYDFHHFISNGKVVLDIVSGNCAVDLVDVAH